MKQTIQLKHLASYLPYGIKVMTHYGVDDLIGIMFSDDTDYSKTSIPQHNINNPLANTEKQCLNFSDVKPILRPMSDLKKFKLPEPPEPINMSPAVIFSDNTIEMCYYNEYEFLFENHFDVFGLIEKGLAIDINKIR